MRPFLYTFPDWLPFFGGQPLYAYGTMLGLSFVVGWSLCLALCRRDTLDEDKVKLTLMVVVASAVLGARALHFITDTSAEFSLWQFLQFRDGGMVAYGGMLAAVLTSYLCAALLRLDWQRFADNATPGLAMGLGITRIGCWLFGCDYGQSCTQPFALQYPRWDFPGTLERLSPAYTAHADHASSGALTHLFLSLPVWPTQLLESLLGFTLFAALLLRKPYSRHPGELVSIFFLTYGTGRWLLELIRGDADRGTDIWHTGLTPSQLISMMMILFSLYALRRTRCHV